MSRFLNDRLSSLKAYVPGEQPQDMQYIKLNTNESPYPPSPLVSKVAEAEAKKLNLYSDPDCRALNAKIAEHYGVSPSNVIMTNGSDEILSFAFQAFCDNKTKAAFPDISYGFYRVYGALYGIDCIEIPLRDDLTVNPDDYVGIGRTIFIANPNAPTGISLTPEDIERIVAGNPENVVVIDQAYIDFGGESCVGLTKKYKNLLVTMTYSKSRSMAGARLGFGIADKELISDLNRIKFSTNPYNINRMTMAAGIAAIDENNYYEENCAKIIATRERTAANLRAIGFYCTDSDANFIFAKNPLISGKEFYLELKKRGILVRHFDTPRIGDYVRITVGTDEQMQALIGAAEDILNGRKTK